MNKGLLVVCLLISIASTGQVQLQTGAAEVGFPLFQYMDDKSRLSAGFNMTYISGNGLKVNEPASSLGTGWAIQGGGVITRMQHGEPDDQLFVDLVQNGPSHDYRERTVFGTQIDYYYPDGYLYSTVSPQNSVPNEVCYAPIFTNWLPYEYKANYDDREQDVFIFQFNNRSGQFVIGKDFVPRVLEDSRLQITIDTVDMTAQKIRTRITAFTITDEAGIKYKFSAHEITDVLKTNDFSAVINDVQIYEQVELISNTLRKVITKWFLTEIVNPFTNEKIIFTYETYALDFPGAKKISGQINGAVHKKQLVVSRIKTSTKRLTSVTFPDAHQIDFIYSGTTRVDVPGDKALTAINVLYNESLLYGYQFNYGYFFKHEIKPFNFSFAAADKRYARLCLTDFKKVTSDGSSLPPHVFTYNVPESSLGSFHIVPPLFTIYHDPWGYYNNLGGSMNEDAAGDPFSVSLPPSVGRSYTNIDIEHAKYGIIKKIQYPEGGSLEYEYETNKSENSPYTNKYAGGVRVKRTILHDGNLTTSDIIKDYKYVKPPPNNTLSSSWGFETPKFIETKNFRQYSSSGTIHQGINAKDIASTAVISLFTGGFSTNMGILLAKELYYALNNAIIYQIILGFLSDDLIDHLFGGSFRDFTVSLVSSDNKNLINPLPMQYSRVEVVEVGNNSSVVYEFTDDVFHALRVPSPFASPYSSAKQRAASWVYGQPRFITWKNSSGQDVRKVENQYTVIQNEINSANCLSRSWEANSIVTAAATGHGGDHASKFESQFITSQTFYPIQGRIRLDKSIETVFNNNGEFTSSETSFTYSPNNFLVRKVSKKNSKGDYSGITTYYTSDYNISGVINNMKSANLVNMPVSVNSWIKGPLTADNEKLISSTVTEYNTITSGDYRPYQMFESELTAPLDNTVADDDNFSSTNFKTYPYLKHQGTLLYTQGNLSQQTGVFGNSNKSTIYDYNQRLVTAEASNALQSRICYTSFEADGNGGWIYNPSGVKTTYNPMGKKCFDLTTGNIGLSNWFMPEPIVISMWTTGSEIFINRSYIGISSSFQIVPTKSGPTINGWKYCEFTFELGEIDDFYISGNGLVDELRLHPVNAQMTTYCYEPGIGKTAECDATNRIVYYDYDKLGRIIGVRDQYRNLIKAYEYNYKQ